MLFFFLSFLFNVSWNIFKIEDIGRGFLSEIGLSFAFMLIT